MVYHNDLSIDSGGGFVYADYAEYVYQVKGSLYKESNGAYLYDPDNADSIFTKVSDKSGGDWKVETNVDTSMLTPGVYATRLLNVNWDGTMEGTADVSDFLPEGMELVYTDINNIGGAIKNNNSMHPKTEYIEELNRDSE